MTDLKAMLAETLEICAKTDAENVGYCMRMGGLEHEDQDEDVVALLTTVPKLAKALRVAVDSIQDWVEDWKSEDPPLTRDNIQYAENLLTQISAILEAGEK